ncbi:MAG: hypothetical protein WCG47_09655 [Dermatophilaceae bacterium]
MAAEHFQWAVSCVENLYLLQDLAKVEPPTGEATTKSGHRSLSVGQGYMTWAAVSAMGAFDRIAAAFGALHLGLRRDSRVDDFADLWKQRREFCSEHHPVRAWMRDVRQDQAFTDTLNVARHPMVHSTTRLQVSMSIAIGKPPAGVPGRRNHPHAFCIAKDRAMPPRAFMEEVTPSATRHLMSALGLVESGKGLPDEVASMFEDND